VTLRRCRFPLAVLACALLGAASAEASFPGREGRIVFTRAGDGRTTLLSADARTGRVRRLTAAPRRCVRQGGFWADYEPSFSASGRQIAFVHEDDCSPGTTDGIYVMRADGRDRRLVVPYLDRRFYIEWPAFEPDGEVLTFVRRNVKNGHSVLFATLLERDAPPILRLGGRFLFEPFQDDPDWSARGRLALSTIGISALLSNGNFLQVSHGNDWAPSWAPSGSRFAFMRLAEQRGPNPSVGTVHVAPAGPGARGRPRRLVTGLAALYPAWSPAGGRIAFVRAPGGLGTRGDLAVVGARGGPMRLLVRNVVADRIAWQPLPR
jgi:Tol biopolymer transport system component